MKARSFSEPSLLLVHSVGLEVNQANCKEYQVVNDRIRCSEIQNILSIKNKPPENKHTAFIHNKMAQDAYTGKKFS